MDALREPLVRNRPHEPGRSHQHFGSLDRGRLQLGRVLRRRRGHHLCARVLLVVEQVRDQLGGVIAKKSLTG